MSNINYTPKQKKALAKFNKAVKRLYKQGITVVASTAAYNKDDAHFVTHIHVPDYPEAQVSPNHAVLDCLREVTNEWSKANH